MCSAIRGRLSLSYSAGKQHTSDQLVKTHGFNSPSLPMFGKTTHARAISCFVSAHRKAGHTHANSSRVREPRTHNLSLEPVRLETG